MQNISNRILMERFLKFNNGSQVDVLPLKPCIHENLDNNLKQIEDSMLLIFAQAEFEYLENTLHYFTSLILEEQ